jgi:hypothetical protein
LLISRLLTNPNYLYPYTACLSSMVTGVGCAVRGRPRRVETQHLTLSYVFVSVVSVWYRLRTANRRYLVLRSTSQRAKPEFTKLCSSGRFSHTVRRLSVMLEPVIMTPNLINLPHSLSHMLGDTAGTGRGPCGRRSAVCTAHGRGPRDRPRATRGAGAPAARDRPRATHGAARRAVAAGGVAVTRG